MNRTGLLRALLTGAAIGGLAIALYAQTYQPGNFVYFQGVKIKQVFNAEATSSFTVNSATALVTLNGPLHMGSYVDNVTAGTSAVQFASKLNVVGGACPGAAGTCNEHPSLGATLADGSIEHGSSWRTGAVTQQDAKIHMVDDGTNYGVQFSNSIQALWATPFALPASATTQFMEITTNANRVATTVTGVSSSGSGNIARVTSPTFVTPALGVATATSLAIGGGATIAYAGRCTASATINNIPAHQWNAVSATCTGIQAGDDLICTLTAGSTDANVMFGGCSAGSGTVGVVLGNMDDGATHSATQTLQVMFFR